MTEVFVRSLMTFIELHDKTPSPTNHLHHLQVPAITPITVNLENWNYRGARGQDVAYFKKLELRAIKNYHHEKVLLSLMLEV